MMIFGLQLRAIWHGRGQGLLRVSPSAARYDLGLWAKSHKVTWNTNLPMTIVTMTIHMMWIWCEYDMNMLFFFFHTLINYHIHHIHSMNMDDHQIWTNPVFHLMIEIMIPKFLDELGQKFQHFFSWTSAERGLDPNRCLADPLALWSAGTRTKRPQKAKASVSLRSIESIQNTS